MKRAKFFLMAAALLAVIGGALAFKAQKFNSTPVYSITGVTTISSTQGNAVYSTTVPICTTTNLFFTLAGSPTTTFTSAISNTVLRNPNTTVTLPATYLGCLSVPDTFITPVP